MIGLPAGLGLHVMTGIPLWAETVAQLHFNGADGSSSFPDAKGKTWSANAGAVLDTDHKVFGSASLYLGGSSYVTTPASADFAFAGGSFVIEGRLREAVRGANRQVIGQHTTQSTADSAFIVLSNDGVLSASVYSGGSAYTVTASGQHAINTWVAWALERDGDTLRLLIDGAVAASTSVASVTLNTSTQPVCIGVVRRSDGPDPANLYFNGHQDEIRITKGVARYGGAYTPATEEWPDA